MEGTERLRPVLRLFLRISAAIPIILIVVAAICWLGGWRTVQDYGTGLIWAGVAAIAVGIMSQLGGWGLTRGWVSVCPVSIGTNHGRTHKARHRGLGP
jgi:hypothetical protein